MSEEQKMEVTVTRENPILIKAEVHVPWEKVSPSYAEAVKEIGSRAEIPGFRKGKAPAALIKKRFRQQILGDVMQRVVPESLDSLIKEQKIRAVGTPRLHHMHLEEKDHLHFMAELDVLPEIELKEWQGIEAESLKVEVTDEQVAETLAQMRQQATKRETITDRPAAEGDLVTITLTAIDPTNDESLTDIEAYQIRLGDPEAHPLVGALVLGMESEAYKAEEIEAPEDDPFENWRGKKIKVYIDVTEIVKEETPELDDAFAKTQDAESLEDLKEKLKKQLAERAQAEEESQTQARVLSRLVKDYDFDVPKELVEMEAKSQAEQYMMPYMQQLRGDKSATQRVLNDLWRATMPQALVKVRLDLILENIAESLDIQIEESELDQEIEKIMAYSGQSTEEIDLEKIKKELKDSGRLEDFSATIKRRKAVKAVVDAAKITKVDQLTTEPPPAGDGEETASQPTAEPETLPKGQAETAADEGEEVVK